MMPQQAPVSRVEREMDQYFGGHQNDAPEAAVESPAAAIVRTEVEGDPEVMLALLEKKAELAPRFKAALDFLLMSQTYAKDWTQFGDKMCLGSAGAERVGKNFPIVIFDVKWTKQEFTDSLGKGYRYIYEAKAQLYGHMTYSSGSYSTRDELLGKKGDSFRALEEINEGDVMRAAENIAKGNIIKAILGLRGIPVEEWQQLMSRAKQDPSKAKKVDHGSGTQGGTSADDTAKQKELAEICIEIANAGKVIVTKDEFKTFVLDDAWSDANPVDIAKQSCVTMSTFMNKDGKKVQGKGAKDLRDKWLEKTLAKAREVKKQLEVQP